MVPAEKNKVSSVDNALNQIQRQFGKGSIMRLGSREAELVPAIPTGSLSLDIALG
ncbi:MAG: DNA recombination/repair protein RecA, partial [Desulfofustis sp.]|nr:DNA recombination/repair protein RecA [Desulfofustis sp.]